MKKKNSVKIKALKSKVVIDGARNALRKEKNLSPTFKTSFELLLDFTSDLVNQLGLNSSNSSKPPSQDPNRSRARKAKGRRKKPGGQKGHKGNYLRQFEKPTIVEQILVDQDTLPHGDYEHVGFEKRQVIDIEVSVLVTEFQAEIVKNKKGQEFIADFPNGVKEPVQYGNSVKVSSVYLSQSQLIPLDRVRDCFQDQFGLPLSKGSITNYNLLCYNTLETFDAWAKRELLKSLCNNADETGINVNGKKYWLHCLSNEKIVLFHPDEKRGAEAMDRMGILPAYKGILVHDHWKTYFNYEECLHALCNAHHLRELERAYEQDGQKWARKMQKLLFEMKDATEKSGGALSKKNADKFRNRYRRLIANAQKECPRNKKSRGQSKSRNLLERLAGFETETLRFMEDLNVPFTNNRAENDQRMVKVQQKISGCFRSMQGAQIFCRIRSYLLTCRKNGIGATEALELIFGGSLPSFIT
jgi:transposase